MEPWPSGLRRTPGKRVGVLPLEGSNPSGSAIYPLLKVALHEVLVRRTKKALPTWAALF